MEYSAAATKRLNSYAFLPSKRVKKYVDAHGLFIQAAAAFITQATAIEQSNRQSNNELSNQSGHTLSGHSTNQTSNDAAHLAVPSVDSHDPSSNQSNKQPIHQSLSADSIPCGHPSTSQSSQSILHSINHPTSHNQPTASPVLSPSSGASSYQSTNRTNKQSLLYRKAAENWFQASHLAHTKLDQPRLSLSAMIETTLAYEAAGDWQDAYVNMKRAIEMREILSRSNNQTINQQNQTNNQSPDVSPTKSPKSAEPRGRKLSDRTHDQSSNRRKSRSTPPSPVHAAVEQTNNHSFDNSSMSPPTSHQTISHSTNQPIGHSSNQPHNQSVEQPPSPQLNPKKQGLVSKMKQLIVRTKKDHSNDQSNNQTMSPPPVSHHITQPDEHIHDTVDPHSIDIALDQSDDAPFSVSVSLDQSSNQSNNRSTKPAMQHAADTNSLSPPNSPMTTQTLNSLTVPYLRSSDEPISQTFHHQSSLSTDERLRCGYVTTNRAALLDPAMSLLLAEVACSIALGLHHQTNIQSINQAANQSNKQSNNQSNKQPTNQTSNSASKQTNEQTTSGQQSFKQAIDAMELALKLCESIHQMDHSITLNHSNNQSMFDTPNQQLISAIEMIRLHGSNTLAHWLVHHLNSQSTSLSTVPKPPNNQSINQSNNQPLNQQTSVLNEHANDVAVYIRVKELCFKCVRLLDTKPSVSSADTRSEDLDAVSDRQEQVWQTLLKSRYHQTPLIGCYSFSPLSSRSSLLFTGGLVEILNQSITGCLSTRVLYTPLYLKSCIELDSNFLSTEECCLLRQIFGFLYLSFAAPHRLIDYGGNSHEDQYRRVLLSLWGNEIWQEMTNCLVLFVARKRGVTFQQVTEEAAINQKNNQANKQIHTYAASFMNQTDPSEGVDWQSINGLDDQTIKLLLRVKQMIREFTMAPALRSHGLGG